MLTTNRSAFVVGAGLGATLMCLLDPVRGARRRGRLRDGVTHATNVAARGAGKAGRDVWHRAQGTAASLRHLVQPAAADDRILEGRVRANLGRIASHPHAVRVEVTDGIATLTGPILEREADRLIRASASVRGVRKVEDRLERHKQAGDHPSLQGGRAPVGDRLDVLQENWAPATRLVVGIAGSALLATGARRRDAAGLAAVTAGSALLARALANVPIGRFVGLTGGRRAVDVQKTVTIDAPVSEVYAFWSAVENFPRFMSRVLEVRPSSVVAGQSHWKVAGPAGTHVEFDAEVTRAIPNQLLAWRTLPGATVAHGGVIRFEPEGDRTRLQVRMSYNPPAGWIGHGVASLFGVDPKHSMDEDLVRMKTLVETGRFPRDAAQAPATSEAPVMPS